MCQIGVKNRVKIQRIEPGVKGFESVVTRIASHYTSPHCDVKNSYLWDTHSTLILKMSV